MHPRAPLMIVDVQGQGLVALALDTHRRVLFADSRLAAGRRGRWSADGHTFAAIEGINSQQHIGEAEVCRLTMWTSAGELCYRSEPLPAIVFPPYWHPCKEVCVLVADSHLLWWENDIITIICPLAGHRPWDAAAGWDASGAYLAVMAGPLILVFAADGTLHSHLETDWDVGFESLAWHPAEPVLATGAWDSMIRLWSPDGELLTTLSADPRPAPPISRRTSIGTPMIVTWSADGAFLAAALRDGSIYLYGIDDQANP